MDCVHKISQREILPYVSKMEVLNEIYPNESESNIKLVKQLTQIRKSVLIPGPVAEWVLKVMETYQGICFNRLAK